MAAGKKQENESFSITGNRKGAYNQLVSESVQFEQRMDALNN